MNFIFRVANFKQILATSQAKQFVPVGKQISRPVCIKETKRAYHTNSSSNTELDPWYTTGIVDSEGSFMIVLIPTTGARTHKISLRFQVTQKSHSEAILYKLQEFFGCGEVLDSGKDCKIFLIQKKQDILTKVVPHFTQYPLVTSKELNFNTFKQAATMVQENKHLTQSGIDKIAELKATMNKGRSFAELFNHCNNKNIVIQPAWLQAFVDGDGTFSTLLTKNSETGKVVTRNRLGITQSTHDFGVLKAIRDYLGVGSLSPTQDKVDTLDKANLANENSFYYNSTPESFIPFFEKYPPLTRKRLDYDDFLKFYYLKKDKAHLTPSGFEAMKEIAINMNSGRDGLDKSRRKTNNN